MSKVVKEIKPKRIRNIKAARRLLSKYIYDFQTKKVTNEDAKTLAYLLIKYSELYKTETLENLEKKIDSIETRLNQKNN